MIPGLFRGAVPFSGGAARIPERLGGFSREALFVLLLAAAYLLFLLLRAVSGRGVRRRIRALAKNAVEMTPNQFFRMRNAHERKQRRHISKKYDFPGVYILYNKKKNKYYVGQASSVLQRINQHLTGHGNGDVYADYKYGDRFTITAIRLRGSGFSTLNDLERNTIEVYNAYSEGYNKTRGNR